MIHLCSLVKEGRICGQRAANVFSLTLNSIEKLHLVAFIPGGFDPSRFSYRIDFGGPANRVRIALGCFRTL